MNVVVYLDLYMVEPEACLCICLSGTTFMYDWIIVSGGSWLLSNCGIHSSLSLSFYFPFWVFKRRSICAYIILAMCIYILLLLLHSLYFFLLLCFLLVKTGWLAPSFFLFFPWLCLPLLSLWVPEFEDLGWVGHREAGLQYLSLLGSSSSGSKIQFVSVKEGDSSKLSQMKPFQIEHIFLF